MFLHAVRRTVTSALLALALAGPADAAERLDRAGLLAFVVQCIATDAAGRPVFPSPGAPACPAPGLQKLRDVAGWRKHDWGQPGPDGIPLLGHQVSDSVIDRSGGREVIVQTFDFGDGTRQFGVYDKGNGDGGDLLTIIRGGVYGFYTEDGGAGEQWFISGRCRDEPGPAGRMAAWLFFADDVRPGAWTARVAQLNMTRSPDECPGEFNAAYTRYRLDTIRVPFRTIVDRSVPPTTERDVETVVSEHYDGTDIPTARQLERFYFGRGLGKYRWERWEHLGRTVMADAAEQARRNAREARCVPVKGSEAPGPDWVMVDCRTWTSLVRMHAPWSAAAFDWAAPVLRRMSDR